MSVKIIVATHKRYRMPDDQIYLPLHVGHAGKEDIGYKGDDTGENISASNARLCELTGLYWAWKNLDGVWNYLNRIAVFNHFRYEPIANYHGQLYNLPFNMNTFHQLWGVNTPAEAEAILNRQREEIADEPKNLEEQAIQLVGRDIYEKLVKGYTEKQWGRSCQELPAFIIRRLPVRMSYDNNYFNHPYQGIPVGGYTRMIANLLANVPVRLGVDYLQHRNELNPLAEKIV